MALRDYSLLRTLRSINGSFSTFISIETGGLDAACCFRILYDCLHRRITVVSFSLCYTHWKLGQIDTRRSVLASREVLMRYRGQSSHIVTPNAILASPKNSVGTFGQSDLSMLC